MMAFAHVPPPLTWWKSCNVCHVLSSDLSKNRLCELPEELCQLMSLETLSLYHNGMRSLSSSLSNLQALTYLNLR